MRQLKSLAIAGAVGAAMAMLKLRGLSVGAEAVTVAFTPSIGLATTGVIVAFVTGTLAGIVPALHVARTEIVPALRATA